MCLPKNEHTFLIIVEDDPLLRHRRVGHASLSQLHKLDSKDLVLGLPKIQFKNKVCDTCARGKNVKSSFMFKKVVSTSRTLELLQIDLCVPMRIMSRGEKGMY